MPSFYTYREMNDTESPLLTSEEEASNEAHALAAKTGQRILVFRAITLVDPPRRKPDPPAVVPTPPKPTIKELKEQMDLDLKTTMSQ